MVERADLRNSRSLRPFWVSSRGAGSHSCHPRPSEISAPSLGRWRLRGVPGLSEVLHPVSGHVGFCSGTGAVVHSCSAQGTLLCLCILNRCLLNAPCSVIEDARGSGLISLISPRDRLVHTWEVPHWIAYIPLDWISPSFIVFYCCVFEW